MLYTPRSNDSSAYTRFRKKMARSKRKGNGIADFHNFVHDSITDGLRNGTSLKGPLLMLKSVVRFVPERVEMFSAALSKLFAKLAKDYIAIRAAHGVCENNVHLIMMVLDICQSSLSFLGNEHRRFFIVTLTQLTEKSKSLNLCRYMLDMVRVGYYIDESLTPAS